MGRKATLELVLDCQDPNRLAEFWREALGYREHYADAELAVLIPKEGSASPLLLQRVPEPKAVKNRMHLDIIVDDIEAEVSRLEALGARRIDHDIQNFGEVSWADCRTRSKTNSASPRASSGDGLAAAAVRREERYGWSLFERRLQWVILRGRRRRDRSERQTLPS